MACVVSSSSRLKFAAIGENFCKGLCMDVLRVSLRRCSIAICMIPTCRVRNMMHFADRRNVLRDPKFVA